MDHDFFNDPPGPQDSNPYPQDEITSKLKRTACILCRKRKLKCDAARPKCATCDRLGHECEYNEVRKKSGPKRGYVKALEARLSQVETQLKSASGADVSPSDGIAFQTDLLSRPAITDLPQRPVNRTFNSASDSGMRQQNTPPLDTSPPETSWDIISMGLEEPLPTLEIQNELHDIYFRKIHPTAPMINKARFYSALSYAPHLRPPVCLRYAMWTLAAGASDAYTDMQQHFYRRARKYVEIDEMRNYGESVMSVWHCQTSVLLSIYEFKNMHFPRAWLSTGRAVRLSQMLGLQRLDGAGLEVKQCIAPPVDWTEREERRRTFWMVFWDDRCASIGTGWPMVIDEQDILTNLPASETAFQNSVSEPTPSLDQALKGNVTNIGSFAAAIMLTALFGRNLLHLHRPTEDEREHDLNGAFWRRHRQIDQTLLNISLNLPDHLRIPRGLPDPNVMFMNMCIHTSIICLHQAAIFKIDRNNLPANIGQESKIRCVTAAAEIANIMRSISHCDLTTLNPFSAFCLYVASRVFVQYLKSRRGDQQILGSLHFLLSAMHALKRKTPLAESFLAQLDVDLEGAGIPTNYGSSIEALRKKGFPPMKHGNNANKPYCSAVGAEGQSLNQEFSNPPGIYAPTGPSLGPDSNMDTSTSPDSVTILDSNKEPFDWTANTPAELRAQGNRMAPFASNGTWEDRIKSQAPADVSWNNEKENSNPFASSFSPQQTRATDADRQASLNEFASIRDRTTFGMLSREQTDSGWVKSLSNTDSNSRHASVDEMNFSPVNSGSTPSMHTHRSGSTGHTPHSESSTSADRPARNNNNSITALPSSNTTGFAGYDDNQPAGFVTFKDYPLASGGESVFSPNVAGNMTQAEFDSLTRTFLPPTPGGELDAWASGIAGLTPGPGEDWSQILESMGSWDGTGAPATPWTGPT